MKRIGEILVENNLISLSSLNEAIQEQQNSDKKLGEILIEGGHLTEDNLDPVEFSIASAFAVQFLIAKPPCPKKPSVNSSSLK